MLTGAKSLWRERGSKEQPSATTTCNAASEPWGGTTPPSNLLWEEVAGQSPKSLGQCGLMLGSLQRKVCGGPRAVPVPATQNCRGFLLLTAEILPKPFHSEDAGPIPTHAQSPLPLPWPSQGPAILILQLIRDHCCTEPVPGLPPRQQRGCNCPLPPLISPNGV